MMAASGDDFQVLHDLLFGAKGRYRSVRATVLHTVDGSVAGREAAEERVETISWGYPPSIFHGFWAPEGTTDHLLLVDAEVGAILRVAARLEDREFYIAEVTEIAYDEQFPEGTFRLELPGVEFERG